MQVIKILLALLLTSSVAHAQCMNHSMATNRLSTFNVAHAGLDGSQINYTTIINTKYGGNGSLLFETRLGKTNFSVSGQFHNSSTYGYSASSKEVALSYRFDLSKGKSLSFGAGFGKSNRSYLSVESPNNYISGSSHFTRLGSVFAGNRFKIGAELQVNIPQNQHGIHNLVNVMYQQQIIDRENFDLSTNLIVSNFNSVVEVDMLFYDKFRLVSGMASRRGNYIGVGYKVTENFELNLSSSIFRGYTTPSSLQFGIKVGFNAARDRNGSARL